MTEATLWQQHRVQNEYPDDGMDTMSFVEACMLRFEV